MPLDALVPLSGNNSNQQCKLKFANKVKMAWAQSNAIIDLGEHFKQHMHVHDSRWPEKTALCNEYIELIIIKY